MEVTASAQRPLRLKKPPIVEAVIGISIPRLPESRLAQMHEAPLIERTYKGPQRVTQSRLEMKIVDGQSAAVTQDEHIGWRWDSENKRYAVQFKIDGFVFSQLGDYETWETFTAEARNLWDIFVGIVGTTDVSEFGVRYINKVYIPASTDLKQYLHVYPKLPDDESPWIITESVMRLGIPISTPSQGMFIHHHLLVPSDKQDHVAVILDNDFRYPFNDKSSSNLWSKIDAVRQVKDDYFRELITERLLETFNV